MKMTPYNDRTVHPIELLKYFFLVGHFLVSTGHDRIIGLSILIDKQ